MSRSLLVRPVGWPVCSAARRQEQPRHRTTPLPGGCGGIVRPAAQPKERLHGRCTPSQRSGMVVRPADSRKDGRAADARHPWGPGGSSAPRHGPKNGRAAIYPSQRAGFVVRPAACTEGRPRRRRPPSQGAGGDRPPRGTARRTAAPPSPAFSEGRGVVRPAARTIVDQAIFDKNKRGDVAG